MSRSVDNIIPVTWNIKRSGIGAVSFGVALAAYGDAMTPEDQVMGLFTSYEDLLERHPTRDDLLGVGKNWFDSGGATLITIGYQYGAAEEAAAPVAKTAKRSAKTAVEVTPQSTAMDDMAVRLAQVASLATPTNFVEAMMKAADSSWFYFPFSTQTPAPLTQDEWENAVSWCDANSRFLSMTVTDETAIDPSVTTDLGSYIKSLGYRRCSIAYTTQNDYMGVRMAGMMGMTDYTQPNSYKDAEYKSINQAPDDLGGTDIATLIAKGYYFNTEIAAKASNTPAMLQNTVSTSQYGETIAEVMGTDSYLINLQNSLLNVVTGQINLPQTPDGQQLAISAANQLGEMYITNGFLGQREVIHPITKETVITRGYITTTVPEDVYKLTDAERGEHKLYPITQYIYRSGSAWTVAATVNVW
nr:hypothetical protein [Vibrio splendidus]AKN36664.1 hypothetical protein [Vibrio sp. FF_482]AKN37839.1 hypothetical protein [Vibrio tasmaniensis]AKN38748.1 hypothetical protein [Enterovibrio norvegicus]AKN38952.1 hypothetical protein [Aliivibrio fischeri]AKN39137.1 hypothetical protein [Vibrio kanaloae]AKN39945.1 hypothetical protein [Vibrio sp. FF_307]